MWSAVASFSFLLHLPASGLPFIRLAFRSQVSWVRGHRRSWGSCGTCEWLFPIGRSWRTRRCRLGTAIPRSMRSWRYVGRCTNHSEWSSCPGTTRGPWWSVWYMRSQACGTSSFLLLYSSHRSQDHPRSWRHCNSCNLPPQKSRHVIWKAWRLSCQRSWVASPPSWWCSLETALRSTTPHSETPSGHPPVRCSRCFGCLQSAMNLQGCLYLGFGPLVKSYFLTK